MHLGEMSPSAEGGQNEITVNERKLSWSVNLDLKQDLILWNLLILAISGLSYLKK